MFLRSKRWVFALGLCSAACFDTHRALVRTAALPPPPDPVVRHSKRLWVELEPGIGAMQCITPKSQRSLCFEDVDQAVAASLKRALWTSFPSVQLLSFGDSAEPGEYVLKLDLRLDALPPSAGGPGWAALAKGRWRLLRDGVPLAGESVESRSRADFAYGRPLGAGAGEVVDAIAFHVGVLLGALPETEPDRPVPLPEVTAQALDGVPERPMLAGN